MDRSAHHGGHEPTGEAEEPSGIACDEGLDGAADICWGDGSSKRDGEAAGNTAPLVAPILPEWLDGSALQLSAGDASLASMCRLAGAAVPTPGAAIPSLRRR